MRTFTIGDVDVAPGQRATVDLPVSTLSNHTHVTLPVHVVHGEERNDPRALLDPAINADRGCTAIARNLRVAKGDPQSARLAYVGCGYQGQLCTMEARAKVARALTEARERFKHEAT